MPNASERLKKPYNCPICGKMLGEVSDGWAWCTNHYEDGLYIPYGFYMLWPNGPVGKPEDA